MSRAYDDYTQKQMQKAEDLLEVPAQLSAAQDSVDALASRLEESAVKIADLQRQLVEANSIKSKMKDYFVGGVIGAILGAVASMFIK